MYSVLVPTDYPFTLHFAFLPRHHCGGPSDSATDSATSQPSTLPTIRPTMVKLSTILAAAAAAVLVLTSTAYAHVQDDVLYGADANAALRQRHLRVAVASSVDEATGLIGSSLSTADDEGAQLGKGSLAGHAPPSADAGHDNTKPPSRHDGSDNPKDHHLPKDDQKQNGPPEGCWRQQARRTPSSKQGQRSPPPPSRRFIVVHGRPRCSRRTGGSPAHAVAAPRQRHGRQQPPRKGRQRND
jgi:hypothetical protein